MIANAGHAGPGTAAHQISVTDRLLRLRRLDERPPDRLGRDLEVPFGPRHEVRRMNDHEFFPVKARADNTKELARCAARCLAVRRGLRVRTMSESRLVSLARSSAEDRLIPDGASPIRATLAAFTPSEALAPPGATRH
jgi:hypothetical protein